MNEDDRAQVIYDLLKAADDHTLTVIEASAALRLLQQHSRRLLKRMESKPSEGVERGLATLERVAEQRLSFQTRLLRGQGELIRVRHELKEHGILRGK